MPLRISRPPVTDTLDARLQALEAEAQDLRPTLEEHTQRITKIEDGIKADKEKAAAAKAADAKKDKKWYEKISLKGYTQLRVNEVFEESGSDALAQVVGTPQLERIRASSFGVFG